MKLQISTDYAMRILQHLHVHKGEVQTATAISGAVGITYPFFIKIANQLKRAGLLVSVQGRHGGYALGRPGHEISYYDVLVSTTGEVKISRCLESGEPCLHGQRSACKVHTFLQGLQGRIIAELSSQSIADLA